MRQITRQEIELAQSILDDVSVHYVGRRTASEYVLSEMAVRLNQVCFDRHASDMTHPLMEKWKVTLATAVNSKGVRYTMGQAMAHPTRINGEEVTR